MCTINCICIHVIIGLYTFVRVSLCPLPSDRVCLLFLVDSLRFSYQGTRARSGAMLHADEPMPGLTASGLYLHLGNVIEMCKQRPFPFQCSWVSRTSICHRRKIWRLTAAWLRSSGLGARLIKVRVHVSRPIPLYWLADCCTITLR